MNQQLRDLNARLDALEEHFNTLALQIDRVAQALRDPGSPPPDDLGTALTAAQHDFAELGDCALGFGESLGVVPTDETGSLDSLVRLRAFVALIDATEQRREDESIRQNALAVLDRVMALWHRSNTDFQPLHASQSTTRAIYSQIGDTADVEGLQVAQAIIDGVHPLAALLTLAEGWNHLDADRCKELQDQVSQTFGSKLAIEAVRGRIVSREQLIGTMQEEAATDTLAEARQGTYAVSPDSNGGAQPSEAPFATQDDSAEIGAAGTVASRLAGAASQDTRPDLGDSPPGEYSSSVFSVFDLLPEDSDVDANLDADEMVSDVEEELQIVEDRPLHDWNAFFSFMKTSEGDDEVQLTSSDTLEPIDEHTLATQVRQSDRLADEVLQSLAAQLRDDTHPDQCAGLTEIIWRLLLIGQAGLAYHLAGRLEQDLADVQSPAPACLMRAVVLGPYIREELGDIANMLAADFELCLADQSSDSGPEQGTARVLLLAAAALQPALIAPGTNAHRLLLSLPDLHGFSNLHSYCQIVAEFGSHMQSLDLNLLQAVYNQAAWQARLDALRTAADSLLLEATTSKIVFPRATDVLRYWAKPEGLLVRLLAPVMQNDLTLLDKAKQEIERLSDTRQINLEVHDIDQRVLRHMSAELIDGAALKRLQEFVGRALECLSVWVKLQESDPGGARGYQRQQAESLRNHLRSTHERVVSELDHYLQSQDDLPLAIRAGVVCCRRAVDQIQSLLDLQDVTTPQDLDPKHLLHGGLLRAPQLARTATGEPGATVATTADAILEALAVGRDWYQALKSYAELRDHDSTARVITYLEAQPHETPYLDGLRRLRERDLRQCRDDLRDDAAETRKQVELAVAYGLLRENERAQLLSEIQLVEEHAAKALLFQEQHNALSAVRHVLQQEREARVDALRQRLQQTDIAPAEPAYARISAVIDAGDIVTANEYIDMALQGKPLPEPVATTNAFDGYFLQRTETAPNGFTETAPSSFKAIFDHLERVAKRPQDIIQIIHELRDYAKGRMKRYRIGPVDLSDVPGPPAAVIADMIESWYSIKRSRQQINPEDVKRVFNGLGFDIISVEPDAGGHGDWFHVTTRPLKDKVRCPVPQYGSNADGHYRLLCVRERPIIDELLDDVDVAPPGTPVIVFYLGRMSEQKRIDLPRLCRERRRMCIVVDDTLLFYLCGQTRRLRALFECTLPFTTLSPYTTTAGVVPPEVFYGRREESRKIFLREEDTCFIYGGRQLGKTALLREVERAYHQPDDGILVRWIDLKTADIGYKRPVDDIWMVLADELKKFNVVPADLPAHAAENTLLDAVQGWIEADSRRSVLLLLDEADRFLEIDARQEFSRAARIKGLMDRTNRRFKVVFAGLHNVARATKQSNHPLAHYGKPVCIGPLLNNGEARAARALIERPLASLGFRFESPDLVTRILSQTNYYPSLIQIYCDQLIKHCTDPQRAFEWSKPPYYITAEQVDEVYHSQELRAKILQRFNLTLQLDPRYEVIAYTVAYGSLADGGRGLATGLTLDEIKQEALSAWRVGFRESADDDAFQTLLEEMVGLGVLRAVDDKRYALRNPNVVFLMGSESDIIDRLIQPREAPPEYQPATFRSALRSPHPDMHLPLSPLTARQEAELRERDGVTLCCGCVAAGIDDVEPFLREAFGKEHVRRFDGADLDGFRRWLDALAEHPSGEMTLALIARTRPWNAGWLDAALQQPHDLKAVRVVFCADPPALWRLTREVAPALDMLIERGLVLMPLTPWEDDTLRRWLLDCGFGPIQRQGRTRITQDTGNWPLLLHHFYRRASSDPHHWERPLQEILVAIEQRPPFRRELAALLGLDCTVPRKVLRVLAEFEDGLTIDDLLAMIDNEIPAEVVRQSLHWAKLLSIAVPTAPDAQNLSLLSDSDQWVVNPLVRRVIKHL